MQNSRHAALPYRPEIVGLRGIAVLAVVVYHLLPAYVPGGFLGVDVFFVLSGYLITGIIGNGIKGGTFTLTHFYLRRVRRILPALFVMLAVVTITSAVVLMPNDLKDYGRSLAAQSVFAGNIYFYFKSDYFDTPSLLKPILNCWSLSAEEQFYLLYPVLLLGLSKVVKDLKYVIAFLFLLAVAAAGAVFHRDPSAAFYLLPGRCWELLLGGMCAVFFRKPFSGTTGAIGLIAGVIVMVASFVVVTPNTSLGGFGAVAAVAGAALTVLAAPASGVSMLLSNKPLRFMGNVSYSWYLWHWPLLVFFTYVKGSEPGAAGVIVLFAASLLLAWISYRYIETPARYGAIFSRKITWFALAAAISGGFLVTGFVIDRQEGFPGRLDPKIVRVFRQATRQTPCAPRVFMGKDSLRVAGRCDTGDVGQPPGILVWGDSHSGMLEPVLNELRAQSGRRYAIYSCPAALNVFLANYDASYATSPCYRSNRDIVGYIRRNHIRDVLFASFWTEYTEGRELKMEGAGQRDKLYADSSSVRFSIADSKRVFREKFTRTVALLRAAGADVWILEQVPQHTFWVPNEIGKRIRYHQDTLRIGRPLAEYARRQSFTNGVFRQLAADPHVHLLDPSPYFLERGDFLTAYRNGKSLYFDNNHLSPAGARLLKPLLQPVFEAAARR